MDEMSVNLYFEAPSASGTQSPKARKREADKATKEARQLRRTPKPIQARTPAQRAYIDALLADTLVMAEGPAGVGKTYVPARVFGAQLASGQIKKIYLARPNVSKAKHRNGFLPGTMEEKTAPWLVPIFEGLKDAMGVDQFERFRREKQIEEVPFEFIQGRTFKDAACIVDEAENLDLDDLYITLTRQGDGLTMVLAGDVNQCRIPDSGFAEVVNMAMAMEDTSVIRFTEEDVVRSKQAKQWVAAFARRAARVAAPPNVVSISGGPFGGPVPDYMRGSLTSLS